MMSKRFEFDYRLCVGCEGCVVACKQQNRAEKGQGLRKVLQVNPGRNDKMPSYPISVSCNHCTDPNCIKVCRQNAIMRREDGIVELHEERCNQCMECVAACPYDAIKYSSRVNKMIKCNMCVDNLPEGSVPMCIENCPTGALTVVDDDIRNVTEHLLDDIFEELDCRATKVEDGAKDTGRWSDGCKDEP